MRITFVLPPLGYSGGIRVIAIYADRLRKRGHEVLVVAPANPRHRPMEYVRHFLWTRRLLPIFGPARSPSHLDHVDVPCKILDTNRPAVDADLPDADAVVATWWETAEWVAALGPSKGAKVYFLQHHEVWYYMPVDRVKATWRLPMRKIVVADWLADLARSEYGDDRVSLVPNAVDLDQFHAPPRSRNAVPTVGLMYSTTPFKGSDIGMKAFEIAAGQVPGLRLLAFGADPIGGTVPLARGAEFHLRPPQDKLRDLYGRCDAWLFASRDEGFGLPILEAMACRTPVIGTPAGAAPELIARGGGYLVRPEDPEDMARAIVRLCRLPPDDWRAMSDRAHETATRYTWDQATDRFEAALRDAIERPSTGPN